MEQTELKEFLRKEPERGGLAAVFETDDRTDRLRVFLEGCSSVEASADPAYHWPTETDPHAAEVVEWEKSNLAELFPNICKK